MLLDVVPAMKMLRVVFAIEFFLWVIRPLLNILTISVLAYLRGEAMVPVTKAQVIAAADKKRMMKSLELV